MDGDDDPGVYHHLRPVESEFEAGIYRVVGTAGGEVTLLRVAGPDGRRRHTGEITTVSRDALDGFAPAENPNGNRPWLVRVSGGLAAFVWSVRIFARSLANRPVLSALALALIAAGAIGEGRLPVGEAVLDGATLVGTIMLVYLGALRLL